MRPPRESPRHDHLGDAACGNREDRFRQRRSLRLVGGREAPYARRVQRLAHDELAAVIVHRLCGDAYLNLTHVPNLNPHGVYAKFAASQRSISSAAIPFRAA